MANLDRCHPDQHRPSLTPPPPDGSAQVLGDLRPGGARGAGAGLGMPGARGAARGRGARAWCGARRVRVEAQKPLGLVLEERARGGIFVGEVAAEGACAGEVQVGDELVLTSGVVYTKTEDYGGVQVRKGAEKVMMPTRGETFDTVMAAIGSHPGHETVVLEFLRPDPVPDVEADVEFGWGVGAAASGGESAP